MSKKVKIGLIIGIAALICVIAIVLIFVFLADTDDEHKHTLMHSDAVAATCTENGSVEYWTCTECGKHFADENAAEELDSVVVPALGHDFADYEVKTAATCTQPGEEVSTCSRCGEEHIRTIEALGHDWDDGAVTTLATCTQEGVMTYSCSRCGETKTETIEKVAHTPGEAIRENEKAASCEQEGSYDVVVYCSVCQEEISRNTETIKALGHNWNSGSVTRQPTCTSSGMRVHTCTRCSETRTETIAALGHDWDSGTITTSATCTQTGLQSFRCTRCSETRTEIIDALGHNWNDGKVTTEPNCEDPGVRTYTCSWCLETKTEEISALGHDPEEASCENNIPASCETEGSYDSVVHCSRCDKELSREHIVVDRLGHDWDDGVITVPATCTQEGTMTYSCSRCDKTKTETIEETAHTPDEAVRENVVESSCEKAGSYDEVVKCTICGEELSRKNVTVDKLGHDPKTAVRENEVATSCEEPGSYDLVVYCSRCNQELSREHVEVAVLGHDWDEGIITKEPTCTEKGVRTFTCSRCSKTKEEDIESIPHDYVWMIDKEATCIEEGSRHQECSVCHLKLENSDETIATIEHSYQVSAQLSDYSECEGGRKISTCSVCDDVLTEQLKGKGHNYVDGICTVCGESEPTNVFTISSVDGVVGETVSVTITLGGVVKTSGFVITFNYDPDSLAYITYSSGQYPLTVNASNAGTITFMNANATNYTDGGTVITMTFLVKNNAESGSSSLNATVTDIKEVWKDYSIHNTNSSVIDGQLTIE